jgi:hypothetical protein
MLRCRTRRLQQLTIHDGLDERRQHTGVIERRVNVIGLGGTGLAGTAQEDRLAAGGSPGRVEGHALSAGSERLR